MESSTHTGKTKVSGNKTSSSCLQRDHEHPIFVRINRMAKKGPICTQAFSRTKVPVNSVRSLFHNLIYGIELNNTKAAFSPYHAVIHIIPIIFIFRQGQNLYQTFKTARIGLSKTCFPSIFLPSGGENRPG